MERAAGPSPIMISIGNLPLPDTTPLPPLVKDGGLINKQYIVWFKVSEHCCQIAAFSSTGPEVVRKLTPISLAKYWQA